MEKLFLNLLEMSLIGSYVILAVLFTRVFLQKFPKIYSYLLWTVVFFRLLCPVTLESTMSILPEPTKGVDFSRFGDLQPVEQVKNPENTTIFPDSPSSTPIDVQSNEVTETSVTEKKNLSLLKILLFIWFIGIFFASGYSLFSLFKLKKMLKSAVHFEKNIYFIDTSDSPFVFGLWKPKIYLPAQVTEEELSYIIAHEQEHIRRFDHFTRLICHFAVMLHWFNPLVWLAYYSSENDMEQSCDEAVLKEESVKVRGEYARTLLKFSGDANFMTPLAFSESNTKGRVKNIMKMKKRKLWASCLVAMVVFCMLVACGTNQSDKTDSIIPILMSENTPYHQGAMEKGEKAVYFSENAEQEISWALGEYSFQKGTDNLNKLQWEILESSPTISNVSEGDTLYLVNAGELELELILFLSNSMIFSLPPNVDITYVDELNGAEPQKLHFEEGLEVYVFQEDTQVEYRLMEGSNTAKEQLIISTDLLPSGEEDMVWFRHSEIDLIGKSISMFDENTEIVLIGVENTSTETLVSTLEHLTNYANSEIQLKNN